MKNRVSRTSMFYLFLEFLSLRFMCKTNSVERRPVWLRSQIKGLQQGNRPCTSLVIAPMKSHFPIENTFLRVASVSTGYSVAYDDKYTLLHSFNFLGLPGCRTCTASTKKTEHLSFRHSIFVRDGLTGIFSCQFIDYSWNAVSVSCVFHEPQFFVLFSVEVDLHLRTLTIGCSNVFISVSYRLAPFAEA